MGIVRGRVVDAQSGKPLDQINVWFNDAATAGHANVRGGYSVSMLYPGRRIATKDGTFSVPDLTNGQRIAVSVAAEGYLKCVAPNVVVAPEDETKTVDFALERIDASKLTTFSGRVVDQVGHHVEGASLRLVLSSKPDPDSMDLFGPSRRSVGPVAGEISCDQCLEAVSDAGGKFEFNNVLPDRCWQLACWDKLKTENHTISGEKTTLGQPQYVTITLEQAPARIIVTIDLAKYPKADQVVASQRGANPPPVQFDIIQGQSRYDFEDLEPGDYNITLLSKPVLTKNAAGELDASVQAIGSERVQVKKGETAKVRF
jgi:Carboxypeptidase regulatory-like domain